MRIGRLRHRLRIDRRIESRDLATGAVNIAWMEIATRDGELVPLSGRELIAAQAVQSEIIARAVIRMTEGVDASMRVVCRGIVYSIKAVLPDPTLSRHLTLMLASGVEHGDASVYVPLEFAMNGQPLNLQPDGSSMDFA